MNSLKDLLSKKVARGIEKGASNLAEQSVGKSICMLSFEPEIPEELKKRLKK